MGTINNFVGKNGILRHNTAYGKILVSTREDATLKTNQIVFVGLADILNKLAMNDRILERQIKQANIRQFDIADDKLADLSSYSADDVPTAYTSFYRQKLISHIAEYHRSDSLVTQVNDDYMPVSCDSLNVDLSKTDFISINKTSDLATTELTGDFVIDMTSNEDSASYASAVQAYAKNTKTKDVYAKSINAGGSLGDAQLKTLDTVPFICKNWASGIKELCIYVPTTFTFYKNGITDLKILVDNAVFKFTQVFYVDITAQSLPLQITKDSTQVFNSIIGQSLVVNSNLDSMDYHRSSLQYDFKCIGSDAQAIRIIGY